MKYKVFWILLLLFSADLFAQDIDLHFVNFGSREGLSSSTVNAIIKDKYGFMWFATDDGLNKFDGLRFTVYRHNVNDSTTLRSNRVLGLYEDKDGNVWVGTSASLSLYNRSRNTFEHINLTYGNAARVMCGDKQGNLWVGGYGGVFRYNHSTGVVKRYVVEDPVPGHLASNTVTSLFEDNHGRMWIGTNAGLQLYQPATDQFLLFAAGPNTGSISDNIIKAILQDQRGDLWIGTNDGGLNKFIASDSSFVRYMHADADPYSIRSNRIYCLAADPEGKLWVGTENGLDIFDPQTGRAQRVVNDARNKFSLKGKSLRSFYIDTAGIYWVGTFQSGVSKYDKNLTSFALVQSNPFDPSGLSSPKVTSFAEAPGGKIYVGTDDGGLSLYNPFTGLFKKISLGETPLTILSMERSGDDLWVGTYRQGIFVMNTITGRIRHFTKEDGVSGLSNNEIFALKRDRYGNVWAGTNGQSVDIFDPKTGKFQKFEEYIHGATGDKPATLAFVRAIEEDNAGNIWIASTGRGIDVFNPVLKTLKIYNRGNTGLQIEDIHTFLATTDGRVWLGTAGNGLYYFDASTAGIKSVETSQRVPNSMIFKILQDEAGRIWFSTNKGISSLDVKTKSLRNYTYENGLQQSSFAPGAGLRTSGGELYFGGLEGFNHFVPAKLHYNQNIPKVVFTGLKVDNQDVLPGNAIIDSDISVAEKIRLKYRQNFSVDFTALDFTNPTECQYSYFLEGFDKKWNEVGALKTVVFTNLDPGNYKLLVKATSLNEGWSTEAKVIFIYIKPPFWRTAYAYILYALVAGLILWAIRYRGIQKLKRKFADEQERLRIKQMIEDERKEAERQREFDQAKIKFLTNLSHEFRTPISLISGPVENLLDKETNREKAGQLNMVKRNARRLLNLVNQLLDFRKLEEKELKLNTVQADLVAFVRDVSEAFKDLADRRRIRFALNSSVESYYTVFDKDKIERVLFNLLSNAFKFTGADGEVTVMIGRASPGKEGVMIHIMDTGIGMSAEDRDKIFERFFQGETSADVMNQGSGIGLSITKEFVRLHGGSIDVNSILGKGSDFVVSLPLQELEAVRPLLVQSSGELIEEAIVNAEDEQMTFKSDELLKVLLIEDNEDFRVYLRDHLKAHYKVIEAADGKEGWQKALSSHPHVIISDISMPQMDGITLSNKIKADKRTAHIPIILLTAMTGDANQLKGLKTGASDYLTKPFSADILKVKIRNILLLSHQLKETYERRLKVDTAPVEVQSENDKLLLKITEYIEEKLDADDLSVEQLSKHLFMSRATLYNKVVDLTGETPVEFIRSVRLNKAAEFLENTDMRIVEISYAVGFATPSYFTKAFKLKFNLSPSEYAAQKKKKSE
ncbi:ATP-binding protein [Terrimonas sp. NA20]|uniref:histidine kinase n=1 Tax=Terrimonas ginsenosidimutans TaxID=2908004 RepID=A0ABS9KVC6_9BACT|nr:hybrid sensor histidine kinase/response regulator transcription factor [Terrimonas ginsenosidimutans]MCG2616232.1 ATP-binding protein [Terrimonas ginsenosidimutans]